VAGAPSDPAEATLFAMNVPLAEGKLFFD